MSLLLLVGALSLSSCHEDHDDCTKPEISTLTACNKNVSIYSDLDSCVITLSDFDGNDAKGNAMNIEKVDLFSNDDFIDSQTVDSGKVTFKIMNANMKAGKQTIKARYYAENGTYCEEVVHTYTIYDVIYGTTTVDILPPAFVRDLCDVYLVQWYANGEQKKELIDMSSKSYSISLNYTLATYHTISYNILFYIQPKSNIKEILANSTTNYIEDYFKFRENSTFVDSDGTSYGKSGVDRGEPGDPLELSSDDFENTEKAISAIHKRRNFILLTFGKSARGWEDTVFLFSLQNYINE